MKFAKTLSAVVLVLGATLAFADDTALPPVDIDNIPITAAPVGKPQATVGAGSRDKKIDAPDVYILAPRTTGASSHTQPTLYWYLSGDTDVDIDLVIVPQDGGEANPLLKKSYEGHQSAGVFAVSLAAENLTLLENHQYKVTVTLHVSADDRSKNPYSMTYLAVVPKPADLGDNADGPAYAKAGLWYDAVDTLMQASKAGQPAVAPKQLFGLLWAEHVFLNPPVPTPDQTKAAFDSAVKDANEKESHQFKDFAGIIAKLKK